LFVLRIYKESLNGVNLCLLFAIPLCFPISDYNSFHNEGTQLEKGVTNFPLNIVVELKKYF
jgi:hypothetical protein